MSPAYLNPDGTFPLRAGDNVPLIVDADEHKRLCCRWQGRVKYEATGTCTGGVWDTDWEVVLDGGNEVYECVSLNNSDPCDDTPVGEDIELIGSSDQIICDPENFKIGTEVWVYGDVHEGDIECSYANASQGVVAPTEPITGWVVYVYDEWSWDNGLDPEITCDDKVKFPEEEGYGNWDCVDPLDFEYEKECGPPEDPQPGEEDLLRWEGREYKRTECPPE